MSDRSRMSRQRRPGIFTCVLAVALLASAAPARAQGASPAVEAQALFEDAKRLMSANRHAEACPKLERSQELDPGSGTLINLADCYEHVGRLASAFKAFKDAEAGARTAGNAPREQAARERAAALEPRLPRIRLEVADPGVEGLEIERDGVRVEPADWGAPLPVDPGEHVIRAHAPGKKSWERRVIAAERTPPVMVAVPELLPEAVAPAAASAPRAPLTGAAETSASSAGLGTQRTLALVAGGAGVVGIVAGSVYGLKSRSKHDEASDYGCNAARDCTDQRGFDAAEDAVAAGNVSTLAFALGGVALAGGAVLWFTASEAEAPAQTAFGVGPGGVTVRTRW